MPDLLLELFSEEIPASPCDRSETRTHKIKKQHAPILIGGVN